MIKFLFDEDDSALPNVKFILLLKLYSCTYNYK